MKEIDKYKEDKTRTETLKQRGTKTRRVDGQLKWLGHTYFCGIKEGAKINSETKSKCFSRLYLRVDRFITKTKEYSVKISKSTTSRKLLIFLWAKYLALITI